MKPIKILLFLSFVFMLHACSKDQNDDNTGKVAQPKTNSQVKLYSQPKTQKLPEIIIVKDSDTVTIGNLVWMRCTLGKTWANNTCNGRAKTYAWQKAIDTKYQYGFRLPTQQELDSLVFCSKGRESFSNIGNGGGCKTNKHQKPTVNKKAFPKTVNNYYWSSTEISENTQLARGINFELGFNLAFDKKDKAYIRLVRDK